MSYDTGLEIKPATEQQRFADRFKHFLVRTPTQYTKSDLNYLSKRGIENRLLDNLLEFLPDGAIIAGGFALSCVLDDKNAKDIDIFFTSKEAFDKTLALFSLPVDKQSDDWAFQGYKVAEAPKGADNRYVLLTHETRPAVQLLKMVWYDSPEHVIDSFDFTISQFAFTNKGFYYNGEAMLDLAKKRLVLHRMQFPASTLKRLIKYTKKGYYACPGSLVTICEAIQEYKGEMDINSVVYVD